MGFSFTWPHHLTFKTISKTCVCGECDREKWRGRTEKRIDMSIYNKRIRIIITSHTAEQKEFTKLHFLLNKYKLEKFQNEFDC